MGHLLVGTHEQIAAVGKGGETGRAAWQHREAVPLEFKVADNFGTEQTVDVAGGGDLKAGPEFLGHNASADQFATFEDKDLAAPASEIGRGDEAIVAGADDDGVVFVLHESTGDNGENRGVDLFLCLLGNGRKEQ